MIPYKCKCYLLTRSKQIRVALEGAGDLRAEGVVEHLVPLSAQGLERLLLLLRAERVALHDLFLLRYEPARGLASAGHGVLGHVRVHTRCATFIRIDSLVINGRGTIFILDGNQRLRQLENGQVTTLNAAVRSSGFVDGPLDQARFNMIGLGGNLCGGENDDTLYLSDHWNFAVRRIDLKTKTVSTVAGMPKANQVQGAPPAPRQRRYSRNRDGRP